MVYSLPKKEIVLLIMGSATQDSHTFSKKHTTKMIDHKQGLDKIFFKKQESISERVIVIEGSATCQSSKKPCFSASIKIGSVFDKDNSTNPEILYILKVVMNHFPFQFCMDLEKLFKTMFPDSEIAEQFKTARQSAFISLILV